MKIKPYLNYVCNLKKIGTCIVAIGGCWFIYQVRETSQKFQSVVATNALKLEQTQAQYIYLDDPLFKDDFNSCEESDQELPASRKPIIFSNVMKWWKSWNFSLARRYLEIAKNGNKYEQQRAVNSLGSLNHLKDWHYRFLAQILDAKTAVALARMPNCDLRFFLKSPYYYIDRNLYEIIDDLYQLLVNMEKLCGSHHRCLSEFINKKFLNSHRKTLEFDHDLSSVDFTATPGIPWDQQLLINCIQTIYHHSSIDQFSKDVGKAHGLLILMEIQKKFSDNVDVCILLARILSNLSLHIEYLDDIFTSGWIGVLAAWSRHKDIRLAGPAARTLLNLDVDGNNGEKFPRRVYLLHPTERTKSTPKLDVIFIHGLLGGVFISWRQRDAEMSLASVDSTLKLESNSLTSIIGEHPQEIFHDLAKDLENIEWQKIGEDFEVVLYDCPTSMNTAANGPFTCPGYEISDEEERINCNKKRTECWPKDWLPQDVPSIRVIGINYESNLSMWSPPCPLESPRSTISERSNEFTKKLLSTGVGKRPIVWVCHSMGGLLVKNMLVEEWKAEDKHKFCENTKGIIFYSTPHRGSHVAALKQTTQMLVWPSVEVQELREGSPHLLKLHDDFLQMLKKNPIRIVSFSETKPTLVTALKFPLQFVTSQSADPGVGEFYEIPQDHLSICKPANKHSFLYRKIVHFLKNILKTDNKLYD
ncbi:protein SERAC1-like [Chelonus insularis]|uniref:protein SERAC1-like n=1 Tax=Chelonus insularis TaxID=460826 RepID=UPI00158AA1AE|nr:protein SERAC1-like [Chelonus insularis]